MGNNGGVMNLSNRVLTEEEVKRAYHIYLYAHYKRK
ncbi:hypothetical protein LCGC14_1027230 [marine sediment metagenome]|uniref:Uncharacterized protein n=1 Tax=marine sediment metagenome TaxID=412755 RepID=A0A0F9R1N8_9ZZZZ